MNKNNTALLMEMELQYHGELENDNYEKLHIFLEELHNEGILDETEKEAYDNLAYSGKCSPEEYTYVLESIELWNEEEYFRRLDIVNGN